MSVSRVYVHSTVRDIVLDAYAALQAESPAKFTYAEAGLEGGGPLVPHRTHQNGTSVDFFFPVTRDGTPAVYPARPDNKYGYGAVFNYDGHYEDLMFDAGTAAEHMYQLRVAALAHNTDIGRVILNSVFIKRVLQTSRGPYLSMHVKFVPANEPGDLHEQHYHVDFAIPCEP
jgi:penicillin-insensitive murein endopeptidase